MRPPAHVRLQEGGDGPGEPSHILVVRPLTAVPLKRRRQSNAHAQPEPEPAPVPTSRVTIVGVGTPFPSEQAAREWLASSGEAELQTDLVVLARALHAYRLASVDPYVRPPGRREALVARIGFGAGEEVADGRWTDARELRLEASKRSRTERLEPQARFAAILAGRDRALACEELVLRARLDTEEGRPREAALQMLLALDVALTELDSDAAAPALQARLDELRGRRGQAERAARAALSASFSASDQDEVTLTLARIEAALRARTVARG
ncbi:MAG: hypothetical protein M3018_14195 [Actinomycetota bacterium]|nr:hypothetical protein [Actinomycetota bacterium]